jgi:inhibitor of cysteine peptidase
MLKKFAMSVALLSTLLITVACTTANAQKQENQAPAAQEISITGAEEFNSNPHISKQIEIGKDGQVIITLISTASTGFSWNEKATIADNSILEQVKHETIGANSDKVGAAGAEQWTLKAMKTGATTVKLEYSRPWEGGEKGVWTLDLMVTVK